MAFSIAAKVAEILVALLRKYWESQKYFGHDTSSEKIIEKIRTNFATGSLKLFEKLYLYTESQRLHRLVIDLNIFEIA